jgi:hypothetical protein
MALAAGNGADNQPDNEYDRSNSHSYHLPSGEYRGSWAFFYQLFNYQEKQSLNTFGGFEQLPQLAAGAM